MGDLTMRGTHELLARVVPPSARLREDAVWVVAAWAIIPGQPTEGIWLTGAGPTADAATLAVMRRASEYRDYDGCQMVRLVYRGGVLAGIDATDPCSLAGPTTDTDWTVFDGPALVRAVEMIPGVPAGVIVARPVSPPEAASAD